MRLPVIHLFGYYNSISIITTIVSRSYIALPGLFLRFIIAVIVLESSPMSLLMALLAAYSANRGAGPKIKNAQTRIN